MSALKQPAALGHLAEPYQRLVQGLIERAEDNEKTIHELRCTIDDLTDQLHDKEQTCQMHTSSS